MSYIDVAIPGIIGLVLLLSPQSFFIGSRVNPEPKKIRFLRNLGIALLVLATLYLAIKLLGA